MTLVRNGFITSESNFLISLREFRVSLTSIRSSSMQHDIYFANYGPVFKDNFWGEGILTSSAL